MTHRSTRIVGPRDGEILRTPDGSSDRFLLSGDGCALVEHVLAPKALAAPLHRHSREDEHTYVLEGRVGAFLGDEEVLVDPHHLLHKPRGEWHTFWNAGDEPARMLEIIAPGGFEQLFRDLGALDGEPDPDTMAALAAGYGVELDFEATMALVTRLGLVF